MFTSLLCIDSTRRWTAQVASIPGMQQFTAVVTPTEQLDPAALTAPLGELAGRYNLQVGLDPATELYRVTALEGVTQPTDPPPGGLLWDYRRCDSHPTSRLETCGADHTLPGWHWWTDDRRLVHPAGNPDPRCPLVVARTECRSQWRAGSAPGDLLPTRTRGDGLSSPTDLV